MDAIDYTHLRYLVIDDESFVLNLSVRILNKLGCMEVMTANNGSEGIDKLVTSESPYDIIICDLNMPEMDGVEFMRHAAQRDFTGGIIYLSGEDARMLETAYELARAHNLNILGVIPKPLKPDLLQVMLQGFRPVAPQRKYMPQESITESELKEGINSDELKLVFQPKVNIRTGEVSGVETLARWHHAKRGLLGPGTFIPLAERTGLVDEMTDSICSKAIRQCGEWLAAGIEMKTAVNFSINSFTRPGFTDFILNAANAEGVNPKHFILEVTETQIMQDAINCLEIMMRMRLKKFNLSIDDFGTGQSSMAQLKSIPFTELKIDYAFVHGAKHNSSARAILESSIDLARKLKMEIVAEGVETREDWDLIEELGCDTAQGYYCAKPMPNEEFLAFLEKWTGPH